MVESYDASVEVDCGGLRCPAPVIRLAAAIEDVPVDGVVGVVADDSAARPDIEAWCRMRGHAYLGEATAADGTPTYLVKRTR